MMKVVVDSADVFVGDGGDSDDGVRVKRDGGDVKRGYSVVVSFCWGVFIA